MADQERFLRDVAGHEMEILRVDGVHRHLRFRKPGDSSFWFDLVTWPGALCIHGDCGSYVFSRLPDMFEFFRSSDGRINAPYWAEKCVAACTSDGIQEFDQKKFTSEVVGRFREGWRDRDRTTRREAFAALRNDVLDGVEGEADAMGLLSSFVFVGWRFEDYWELNAKKYTFRFLWCLRAIVWGIQKFDEHLARQPVLEHGGRPMTLGECVEAEGG